METGVTFVKILFINFVLSLAYNHQFQIISSKFNPIIDGMDFVTLPVGMLA